MKYRTVIHHNAYDDDNVANFFDPEHPNYMDEDVLYEHLIQWETGEGGDTSSVIPCGKADQQAMFKDGDGQEYMLSYHEGLEYASLTAVDEEDEK